MSDPDPVLLVLCEADLSIVAAVSHRDEVVRCLAEIGVALEHWGVCYDAGAGAAQVDVLSTHASYVAAVKSRGFLAVDVLGVDPDEADPSYAEAADASRRWLLGEVRHPDREALLIVSGTGRLCFRRDGLIHALHLVQGDLVTLPAGLRHWLDVGLRPHLVGLRFYPDPHDWEGEISGETHGERLAEHLDRHSAQHAR